MFQTLINLFKPKPKIKAKVKSPFEQLLERRNYSSGQDLVIVPEQYYLPYEFELGENLIIRLRFLKQPAIIKS